MAKAKSSFTLTTEQQAIDKAVRAGKNVTVKARAGTGKSSTIEAVAPKNSIILSYNRAIADEMQERLSNANKLVSADTFHTFGKSQFPGRPPKIDKAKCRWISSDILFGKGVKPTKPEQYQLLNDLIKAVSWCKTMALTPDSDEENIHKALEDERIDFDISEPDELTEYCQQVMAECANQSWRCDFDDMQWLPFVNGWGAGSVDSLFVDEAQDLNPIREALAYMWGNQIIAVGDDFQAIYAYQGSMSDGLDRFTQLIGAKSMPLTTCWRCPSSHLDLAREIVEDIRNRPKCPKGSITGSASLPEAIEQVDPATGAMIISRTNAPLIRQYYKMRKNYPNPVYMVSGNLAQTLCDLIGAEWEAKKTFDFEKHQKKMEKRINRARSESAKVVLRDHDTALRVVLAEHGNLTKVAELHEVIKKEFSVPKVTPKNSLRLSSMHGAKGLEHHHVIFYGTNQVPHPNAEKEWELSAERNLKYVGLTRSKETLDLIESNEE